MVGAHEHVALERAGEIGKCPGGHVVEGGSDHGIGDGRLHMGRHRAAGRHQRLELVAHADEGVGHRYDHLAREVLEQPPSV